MSERKRVKQWEVRTTSSVRKVIVLASDQAEAFRKAAPMLGNSPLRARDFGPWSRP